jgi:hypothetical protein
VERRLALSAVRTLTSAETAGQTSLFFHDPEFRPEMTIFKASGGRLSGQIFIELFRRPISNLWMTSYADAMTGKTCSRLHRCNP